MKFVEIVTRRTQLKPESVPKGTHKLTTNTFDQLIDFSVLGEQQPWEILSGVLEGVYVGDIGSLMLLFFEISL